MDEYWLKPDDSWVAAYGETISDRQQNPDVQDAAQLLKREASPRLIERYATEGALLWPELDRFRKLVYEQHGSILCDEDWHAALELWTRV